MGSVTLKTTLVTILAASLLHTGTTSGQQAEPLTVKVHSVTVGEKFSAYTGSGPATEAPTLAAQGNQMSTIIGVRAEDGQMDSYMAGTITAKSPGSVLLQVRSDVTNASAIEQPFRLLDIGIRADGGSFAGAGGGSIAFAKNEAGWESVRKQKPEIIPAGKTYRYTHVFGVSKSGQSWMLTYCSRSRSFPS